MFNKYAFVYNEKKQRKKKRKGNKEVMALIALVSEHKPLSIAVISVLFKGMMALHILQ